MLKTNSKQAKENIKKYIMEHFEPYDTDEELMEDKPFNEVCKYILNTVNTEKRYNRSSSEYETFKDWCQGLPHVLDTCYYYNRSAVKDLMIILEETEEEAEKYTESQAEELLTKLLYREIKNNSNK